MSAELAEKRATVKFGAKAAVFVFGRRGLPQTVSAVIQSHGRVLQATHGGAIFWCKDTTAQIMRATSRSQFAWLVGPERIPCSARTEPAVQSKGQRALGGAPDSLACRPLAGPPPHPSEEPQDYIQEAQSRLLRVRLLSLRG